MNLLMEMIPRMAMRLRRYQLKNMAENIRSNGHSESRKKERGLLNTGRILSVFFAIAFSIIALVLIFYPGITSNLPNTYKTEFYEQSILGAAATFGTLAGFLFVLGSFCSQQMEIKRLRQADEIKKRQDYLMMYFEAYKKTKERIQYNQFKSEEAIKRFYFNVNDSVIKNLPTTDLLIDEKLAKSLEKSIADSVFSKGGEFNLYWRSVETVIKYLEETESPDLITYWELMLTQEEMALIFYVSRYHLDKKVVGIGYLLRNGFLGSLEERVLIHKDHVLPIFD